MVNQKLSTEIILLIHGVPSVRGGQPVKGYMEPYNMLDHLQGHPIQIVGLQIVVETSITIILLAVEMWLT